MSKMRTEITVETSYIVMRGRIQIGMNFYGPFNTPEEADEYCSKNFPDDTSIIMPLIKEIEEGNKA